MEQGGISSPFTLNKISESHLGTHCFMPHYYQAEFCAG